MVGLASSRAYTGEFKITLADQTPARSDYDYLFDHLEVYVYNGNKDLVKVEETYNLPDASYRVKDSENMIFVLLVLQAMIKKVFV